MDEDGYYKDTARGYLIDPETFTEDRNLSDYEDLTIEAFPAMYGSWLCWPVIELFGTAYTDCMRFLPDESYSNPTDYAFKVGPV